MATPPTGRIRTRTPPDRLASPRTARLVGLAGFVIAAALPFALWHRALWRIASDFRFDTGYLLTGWLAFGLILFGLLLLVPVLVSIGRHPYSRFYPRSRNALAGWGISFYLLGTALATQVVQLADGFAGH